MQAHVASQAVPVEIRCLLAAAGALLPPALRSDWVREWHAEFWHSLGSGRGSRRRMWARALGAFPDAWVLLRHDYGIAKRIRDASHSRSALAIALALLIIAAASFTNGFSRGRDLLFHSDSAALVLIAQPIPFMGGSSPMPAAQVEAWTRESRTVAELGRWSIEDRLSSGRHVGVCRADATALKLLSESPVKPSCEQLELAGSNAPAFAGVVARLNRGSSIQEAEQGLALTATVHKGWMRPGIVSLSAMRKAPLGPVGLVLGGLMLLSLLAVRAHTLTAWLWAVLRISLAFAVIAGAWIECVARAPITEAAGVPLAWSALLYFLPVVSGCCAAYWLRRDTRQRCRICYHRLTKPVFVGMPGRFLFEPGGTEYLCSAGHGALLAGPVSEPIGDEVWATWSDSWA